MPAPDTHRVTLAQASPRHIAAVRARIPASRVAAEFRRSLDQVYAAGRRGAARLDGQNIFVYRDAPGAPGFLDVEFGVGVEAPFADIGDVVCSATPGGKVAMTTHVGDYATLGAAHSAIVNWCRAHAVSLAGTRWEIYGHWREGAVPRTDVCYLVAP